MKHFLLFTLFILLSISLFSQRAFIHFSNEFHTISNYTYLDNYLVNDDETLKMQITKSWNPNGLLNGAENEDETALFYYFGWSIYNESKGDMAVGDAHNVFIPADDDNSFIHEAHELYTVGNTSYITNELTNGDSSALIFITHNWAVSDIYNTNPVGVWYDDEYDFWGIFNQSLAEMPVDIAYNVYVAKESDMAFVHAATAENISSGYSYIDTSIINNNPNAVLIVTQNYNPNNGAGEYNNNSIGIWYDDSKGQWAIFNQYGSSVPEGADFNILVADLGDGSTLPDGWKAADIGSTIVNGLVNYADGNFLVEASGMDIWDTEDEFTYVYKEVTAGADVEITAKLASLDKAGEWTKGGVMIRQSLDSNAVNSLAFIASDYGANLSHRNAAGASTSIQNGPDTVELGWIRLMKEGNSITAYNSADGESWDEIGSNFVELNGAYYVGLAVASNNTEILSTAVFDSVEVSVSNIPVSDVKQISEDQQLLSIAPNPAINFAHINIKAMGEVSRLGLYTIDGRLIKDLSNQITLGVGGEQQILLDLTTFKEGMYLILMESEGQVLTQKLFKLSK